MYNPSDSGEFFNPRISRLQGALFEARMAGDRVAVVLVHCAGVELTDSQQGFYAGSLLARAIENLLTGGLRKSDMVEAVSRDEFAFVLRPSPSEGVATLAAHRINSMLESPLTFGDKVIAVDSSIGIAMFPDHGADADILLRRAKAAQQSALKQANRLCVYSETEAAPASDRPQYEPRLRLALLQNSLSMAFQPQLDLATGRIVGAEALLRWDDEALGTVPPDRIVAVAEPAGLMDRLTYWVITSAVQWCARFVRVDPEFTVSINIAPSNLREPDLPQFIDRALRTWGVKGANIVVEITESAMLIDQAAANLASRSTISGRAIRPYITWPSCRWTSSRSTCGMSVTC